MITLQIIWFLIIGLLLTVYAILDGFDFGVGFWYLSVKDNDHRRTMLRAIGPVWDGNEVWLITGAGALFAAFPPVYASVFSGFYMAMLLALFALIFRAVAIEFRGAGPDGMWRSFWDVAFSSGSTVAPFLFGVALGNVLYGIPLNVNGDFVGSFLSLLNPFALMVGLLAVVMFAFHGALYLQMKTGGELEAKAETWARRTWPLYLTLFALVDIFSLWTQDRFFQNYQSFWPLWVVPLATLFLLIISGLFQRWGIAVVAFLASCLVIAGQMVKVGISLYPNMVPAVNDPGLSLTIFNSSASFYSLMTILVIAFVGMPLVVLYFTWIYWTFRGKVKLSEEVEGGY